MSMILTVLLGSFVIELLLSLYFFWTMNEEPINPNKEGENRQSIANMLYGWRKSMFIFIVCFLVYFIFYGALNYAIIDVVTISDGITTFTQENNSWMLGWELLKIMIALLYIDFVVLTWRIMNQSQLLVAVFGKRAIKRKNRG